MRKYRIIKLNREKIVSQLTRLVSAMHSLEDLLQYRSGSKLELSVLTLKNEIAILIDEVLS